MRREWRLRDGRDFNRVRATGRSRAHPLLVLYAAPRAVDGDGPTRVGVVTSRRVGNAVVRNRARRRLRESLRLAHPTLAPGWDLVFIVRPRAASAPYADIAGAARTLLAGLGLLERTEA